MPDLLPNPDRAWIDPRKLRDYALNPNHDSGKFKAVFFAQMGYQQDSWMQLERDIRTQHLTQAIAAGKQSPHGLKYVITASLQGPVGAARQVTTVWLAQIRRASCRDRVEIS